MFKLFSAVLVAGVAASSNTTTNGSSNTTTNGSSNSTTTTSTTTGSGTTTSTSSSSSTVDSSEVRRQTISHSVDQTMTLDSATSATLNTATSTTDCKLNPSHDVSVKLSSGTRDALKAAWDSTISSTSEVEVKWMKNMGCTPSSRQRRRLLTTSVTLESDYTVTFIATGADTATYASDVTNSGKTVFEELLKTQLVAQYVAQGMTGVTVTGATSGDITIMPSQTTPEATTTADAFRQVTSVAVGVLAVVVGLAL